MSRAPVSAKATPEFWESFAKLPSPVKRIASQQFRMWKQNSSHPSIRFKKINADLYSARVTKNYRALATKTKEGYVWFWIGHHDVYEQYLES